MELFRFCDENNVFENPLVAVLAAIKLSALRAGIFPEELGYFM